MSTHVRINGKGGKRRVSETCDFCEAQPGEACRNTVNKKYECPDKDCYQMYVTSQEALNCTMHGDVAEIMRTNSQVIF